MTYTCDACGLTVEHNPNRGHVPPDWKFQRIGPRVVTLCSSDRQGWNASEGAAPWLLAQLRSRGILADEP